MDIRMIREQPHLRRVRSKAVKVCSYYVSLFRFSLLLYRNDRKFIKSRIIFGLFWGINPCLGIVLDNKMSHIRTNKIKLNYESRFKFISMDLLILIK